MWRSPWWTHGNKLFNGIMKNPKLNFAVVFIINIVLLYFLLWYVIN